MKALFAQQLFFKIASFSESMDAFWNLYKEETRSTGPSQTDKLDK